MNDKKTLLVVLEIDCEDFSPDERREHAEAMRCPMSEVPSLADVSPEEVANLLEGIPMEGHQEMWFEGTDTFLKFTESGTRILSAAWKTPEATP